ncbi:MAG: hypothetical protein WBE25_09970 [Xanthobacteraceae bacterium]
MPRIRVVCAGLVAAMAIAWVLGGARAQTAPNEPVGKPLALLAGLRPPHEARHAVHGKAVHVAIRKAAARKSHHVRTAAEHGRHVVARKIARQWHEPSEAAVTASAFAEQPPAQATPAGVEPGSAVAPTDGMTAPAPTAAPVSGPVSENAPSPGGASLDPTDVKIQMLRVAAPNQGTGLAPGTQQDTPPVAASNDSAIAQPPPAPQTVLAAPVHRDTSPVGSASWIAQVLAAFGGAVAAGAVAWFLIGGGPVRTYG